jgi:hypothetical protein
MAEQKEKKQSEKYQGKAMLGFATAGFTGFGSLFTTLTAINNPDSGFLVTQIIIGVLSASISAANLQAGIQNTLRANRAEASEEAQEAAREVTQASLARSHRPQLF